LGFGGEFGKPTQNSPTISQKYAKLLEIIVRKVWQNGKINPVLGKAVRILG
jgi:hypothetical protein